MEDHEKEPEGHLGAFDVDEATGEAIKEGAMPVIKKRGVSIDKEELQKIRNFNAESIRVKAEFEEKEKTRRVKEAIIQIEQSLNEEEANKTEEVKALEALILKK